EPAGLEVVEEIAELALALHDEGRDEGELRLLAEGEELVDDLLGALGGHALAAEVAVLLAGAGVEDAEVVVDLGDGADRGARVRRGALLRGGDGGREPAEVGDVRAV